MGVAYRQLVCVYKVQVSHSDYSEDNYYRKYFQFTLERTSIMVCFIIVLLILTSPVYNLASNVTLCVYFRPLIVVSKLGKFAGSFP